MLQGDELITYGFKKVVELLEKIEHNTYIAASHLVQLEGRIARLESTATATEVAVLEIQRQLVKENAHGGLEKG